jgi:hypothetical protein
VPPDPAPTPTPTPALAKPKPKPAPVPAPGPAELKSAPPRSSGRTAPPPVVRVGARIAWLLEQCPKIACAGPVLAGAGTWLTLDPGAMASFKARLHACVDECEGR